MIILKARENWCVSQVTGKRSCQNGGGIPNFFHALFWPSSTLVTAPSPRFNEWSMCKAECKITEVAFRISFVLHANAQSTDFGVESIQ